MTGSEKALPRNTRMSNLIVNKRKEEKKKKKKNILTVHVFHAYVFCVGRLSLYLFMGWTTPRTSQGVKLTSLGAKFRLTVGIF